MGGPAAGILLQRVPEEHQLLALRTWLGTIAEFHHAATKSDLREGWEFLLNWPAALGDEPPEPTCSVGLKMCLIDPEAEYSGDSCLSPADCTAPNHIVDAEFLRSWMLQPQFHMIK